MGRWRAVRSVEGPLHSLVEMSEPYRPSAEHLRLFNGLAREIREHAREYLEVAGWFAREFSLKAIDARKEAARTPEDEEFLEARKREGFVPHQRRDPSGYMERLLRATEHLIEIDDSALPKRDRLEHYRRVILVGTLMTDPDLHEEVPDLASALGMDRSHWPTAKDLTIGIGGEVVLDRWWARDQVFDPAFRHYLPFQALAERALVAVQGARPPASPAAPLTPERLRPVEPPLAVIGPAPTVFDAAALNDSDQGVLLALGIAAIRTPPEGLTAGEIKSLAEKRKLPSFRDADHVRQTIKSLKRREWPIENARNGAGYRLARPLQELCPALAKLLEGTRPIDDQSSTN